MKKNFHLFRIWDTFAKWSKRFWRKRKLFLPFLRKREQLLKKYRRVTLLCWKKVYLCELNR